MEDHYTIKLRDGKYTIINRFGQPLEMLRHGEAWPGADDLRFCNVLIAAADRIEELETALKAALDGSLDPQGTSRHNGMKAYRGHQMIAAWEHDLRRVLEQKS